MKCIHIKMTSLAILFLICSINTRAQGLDEWFNQKKTQTKYLIQQIVALQVYLDYLKKGYNITRDGLNLLSDIKNEEFNLHKDYFNSLQTVTPKILKYSKVAGILSMQITMMKQYHEAWQLVKSSGQFTTAECNYIKTVYDNLMENAGKDLDELHLVTANEEMEMKDDERIRQIDNIYKGMQDKYSFLESFSQRVLQLAVSRNRGKAEAKILMQFYRQQ